MEIDERGRDLEADKALVHPRVRHSISETTFGFMVAVKLVVEEYSPAGWTCSSGHPCLRFDLVRSTT